MDSPHGEHDRSWEEPLFPEEASDQGATPTREAANPRPPPANLRAPVRIARSTQRDR